MDPSEILNVRFHFGGQFIRTGSVLDYVGGDEAFSEIERDKLSLFEVQGHLKDHLEYKESMKLYFHLPGKELAFSDLFDDSGCVSVSDYICVGDVADINVEYHGEQDSEYSSGASDYENELVDEYMDDDEGEQPDMVISAEPDDNGVLTQMKNIHYEQPRASKTTVPNEVDDVAGSQFIFSQICSPDEGNVHSKTEAVHDHSNFRTETYNVQSNVRTEAVNDESNNAISASDSEEDTEYIAHSEDSGENSEVVELRRHARKFKKRMRDTKSWIAGASTTAIPIDLIANMEDQLEGEEKQWSYDSSDEDYSYDEDSDGHMVRRKSPYPRYNNDSEIPHFELTMVFRSKNQLVKALKKYGIVTKKSIVFLK